MLLRIVLIVFIFSCITFAPLTSAKVDFSDKIEQAIIQLPQLQLNTTQIQYYLNKLVKTGLCTGFRTIQKCNYPLFKILVGSLPAIQEFLICIYPWLQGCVVNFFRPEIESIIGPFFDE